MAVLARADAAWYNCGEDVRVRSLRGTIMTIFPSLAEPDIRERVGVESFARGLQYYRQGMILDPRRLGNMLKARCQGSRSAPYRVEVTLDERGIVAGHCTCPVGDGGYCKHIAALLLAWLHAPENFVEVADVGSALARLEKAELVGLVRRLAQRFPEVELQLEFELSRRAVTDSVQTADSDAVKHEIKQSLQRASSRRGSSYTLGQEAQRFLDMAQASLAAGNVRSAAAVYQTIATTILDNYGDEEPYDDYDDYEEMEDEDSSRHEVITTCVTGLGRCLEVTQETELREGVLQTLFEIYHWDVGAGGLGVSDAIPDLLLQRTTPEERRFVAALVREVLPAAPTTERDWAGSYARKQYAQLLLQLERDQLDDEAYLRACRETGMANYLVERLLQLGRVEEAVAAVDQTDDATALALADLFATHDQAAAIEGVMRQRAYASSLPGLLKWLYRRARDVGNLADALSFSEALFWRHPAVQGYQELKEVADGLGRWDEVRASVLGKLASGDQYATLTELYLSEGEITLALETLQRVPQRQGYWYGADSLQIRVARAAEETQPEAAIQLYLREVEQLIKLQGRANYALAAGHLQRVRDLYRGRGQGQTWQSLIGSLREQHRRLPALKDEMHQAGLFEPEPQAAPPESAAPSKAAVVRLLRSPDAPYER
jgi:uncharacterized Zn finger protein